MNKSLIILLLLLNLTSCSNEPETFVDNLPVEVPPIIMSPLDSLKALFKSHSNFNSDGFDFPVGKPDANGYYNAQKFTTNDHLGEDWNAVTGGDSDLGDPIYSSAHGLVNFAKDLGGGWGNIIRIIHQLPSGEFVESLYAHCNSIKVEKGKWVKRGELIGTIGNADGSYLAHLHFEMRAEVKLPIGPGYSSDTTGYINPSRFIQQHRPN